MPQKAVLPGQQPTPNAIKAMPVTRATGIATPVSSAPNSSRTTSNGAIIKATPVAASATAVSEKAFHLQKAATRWITQNIAIEPMA